MVLVVIVVLSSTVVSLFLLVSLLIEPYAVRLSCYESGAAVELSLTQAALSGNYSLQRVCTVTSLLRGVVGDSLEAHVPNTDPNPNLNRKT